MLEEYSPMALGATVVFKALTSPAPATPAATHHIGIAAQRHGGTSQEHPFHHATGPLRCPVQGTEHRPVGQISMAPTSCWMRTVGLASSLQFAPAGPDTTLQMLMSTVGFRKKPERSNVIADTGSPDAVSCTLIPMPCSVRISSDAFLGSLYRIQVPVHDSPSVWPGVSWQ